MLIKTTINKRKFKNILKLIYENKICLKTGAIKSLIKHPMSNIKAMAVAFNRNEKPIGCCVFYEKDFLGFNSSVFVKPQYRRKGIGSKLFETLKKKTKSRRFIVCKNTNFREKFFNKLGL